MVALADTLAFQRPQYDIGQWRADLTGYYSLKLASTLFEYQGAAKPWSIAAAGPNSVRFELRDGDQHVWDAARSRDCERNELASRGDVVHTNQALEVSYSFKLDPGAHNTSDWMVLGQLHQNLEDTSAVAGPVMDMSMDDGTERLCIKARYEDANGQTVVKTLWTDSSDIVRGKDYAVDIKIAADPTGANSRLVVTLNGNTVVDYNGPLGDPKMTGMYWAEGLYRQGDAKETVVATFSDLTFKTGTDVLFPAPSAFIAAPHLGSQAIQAAGDGYDVTFSGTAKAGTLVTLFEGTTAVGSATADALGNVVVTLKGVAGGAHAYTSVASDGTGHSGLASDPVKVVIGSTADVGKQLASLVGDSSVAMVHAVGSTMIDVGSGSDLLAVVRSAKLMAALDGGVYLRATDRITGKSYDTEQRIYDKSGTLIETQRFAAGKVVADSVVSGNTTKVANFAADGSATYVVQTNGVATLSASFGANGAMTLRQVVNPDGSKETDSFSANGTLLRAIATNANGSRAEATYGIAGRDYVQQVSTYDAAGKQLLTARFDTAGKLLYVVDPAKGTTTGFQYGADGSQTGYRIGNADGSYSISSFSAGDVLTKSYTARGVLVSTTHADPAAGVSAAGYAAGDAVHPPAPGTGLAALLQSPDYGTTIASTASYAPSVVANTPATAATNAAAAATLDAAAAASAAITSGAKAIVPTSPVGLPTSTPVSTPGSAPVAATPTGKAPDAPTLAFATTASGQDGQTVSLTGKAVAGATVTLLDAGKAVATGVADASGTVTFAVAAGAGTHSYSAVAATAGSAASVASAKVDVAVGLAADIVAKIGMLSANPALAGISVGGSQIVDVANMSTVALVARFPSAVAKLDGTLQLRVTDKISGKAYDTEKRIYDTSGTLLQTERYAAGKTLLASTVHGNATVATNWNADGSHATSIDKGGRSYAIDSYDAAGNLIGHRTEFADGARETQVFVAQTGALSRDIMQDKSGSRVETTYGITGKAYASQAVAYSAKGAAIYTGQYDTAGHLLTATDVAARTTTTFQYGASGAMTSAKLAKADGSYSVTTFGADGSTVMKTAYFSASGSLLKQDMANPTAAGTSIATLVAASNAHATFGDSLIGGTGADMLKAGTAGSLLMGGGGNDTLVGGSGDDVMFGGTGTDVLTGGGGRDLFHFSPGDFGSEKQGFDRITDFTQGDRIDISAFENVIAGHAGFSLVGTNAFSGHAGELRAYEVGGNTFVSGDLNGDKIADFTLQLDGHHQLATTDFVF